MAGQRTEEQLDCDRAEAQRVDHAASYLRQRLNQGQFAGLSGVYAGYAMCGLLDQLARELRADGLAPALRISLVTLVRDLAREENSSTSVGQQVPGM